MSGNKTDDPVLKGVQNLDSLREERRNLLFCGRCLGSSRGLSPFLAHCYFDLKEKSIKSTCGQMEKESLFFFFFSLSLPPSLLKTGTSVKQKAVESHGSFTSLLMPYLGTKL